MATSTAKPSESASAVTPAVPPLENGDRLTRDEFERRYDAMPDLKKAELIEGVVFMPSPVSLQRHGSPHFDLVAWIGQYRAATPGVIGGDNASIRLDLDNMPQPDILLMVLPSHGGQAKIGEDDYIEGAPELVLEVASSSESFDLHAKLNVYRRNGVREYIVWRTRDRVLDWFCLRGGRYDRVSHGADGIYRSETFPGLWLDPSALARGDMLAVLDVARQGLATPEHTAFVARLQAQAAAGPTPP